MAWRIVRCVLSGYRVVVVTRSFLAVHRAVDRRDALEWFRQYDGSFGESVTMYRYGRLCARRLAVAR
jgi:hypothetical protein